MDTTVARDLVSQAVVDAWPLFSGSVTLDVDNIFFDDRKKDGPPADATAVWSRLIIRHFGGGQSSLSGAAGKALYDRDMLVTIQLFTPFNDGLAVNDAVSQYLVEVFQGKAFNNLWFRDVFSKEIGNDKIWFQTHIMATGTYDQLK